MLVKLLKDFTEKDIHGNEHVKTTIRPARGKYIAWTKDTVIDVSVPTGEKLIAEGHAEAYTPPAEEAPAPEAA